jgi:PAS domain S-box-containing protein
MKYQEKPSMSELAELETYRQVFYASPNFITISRLANGDYIDVNPGFERFTGLKRLEVIGRTSLEIGLFPFPEERTAFMEALKPSGEVHGHHAHLRNHSGEIRDVEVSASIVRLNTEPALIVVVRDVTERKLRDLELKLYRDQLEQLVEQRTAELRLANEQLQETNHKLEEAHNQLLQTEKMASIGQLAAGVAHEINNPIGFVNSNLSSLETYVQSLLQVVTAYEQYGHLLRDMPEQARAIEAIKKEADLDYIKEDVFTLLNESKEGMLRVKKIVQDLKDFSHVGEAEWQLSDLHSGLDSTLNIVNNEIKYKAKIVKEYGTLPNVECLPLELNQVFMNMLVNAAHAIQGFGEIAIRTGSGTEKDKDAVWVEFQDSGVGIKPENLKRIFDPFFTTKPVGQGTGLGLSLSYSIVQKHQGRIEVDSTLGHGTRFRIWLPVRQLATEETPAD